jgi:NADH:ubiquinone reductase (H+-translocating)
VLIGSANHLVFSPLLAEVVGRSIDPLHVVIAGRQLVSRARWLKAAVTHVGLDAGCVQYASNGGARGALRYDHLVLACGTVVHLDHIPGLAANGYPFKSLGDAMALGNTIIARLEEAAVEPDPAERRRQLNVVAIGGGFSGVEVIGEIADVVARTRRFYPQRAGERPRLLLLESGDHLLPELNAPRLSRFAARALERAGVEVRLGARAAEVTSAGVRLVSGEHVPAATVVSTVGVKTNPLIAALGPELERGRLRTDPDMRVTGYRDVWALGDCALVPNAYDGRPSPTTAQFAIRQARALAPNLARAMAGRPTRPFRFRPLGMLASVGHQKAVGEVLGVHISGMPAWILWRVVYLAKLPTLRRKLEVVVDWVWKLFFAPSIVQLEMSRTAGVDRSHCAADEWGSRRGDTVETAIGRT